MTQADKQETTKETSQVDFQKGADVIPMPLSLKEKVSLFYGAHSPVIFICEDIAGRCPIESMVQSRKNITIVFENKAARDIIMNSPFPPRISPQRMTTDSSNSLKKSDLVVLFGSPQSEPKDFVHKKIITVDSFWQLYPPALHKLRGIEYIPYMAEQLSEADKQDPAKVDKAAQFTQQRMEAVAGLKKALGPTYGFK